MALYIVTETQKDYIYGFDEMPEISELHIGVNESGKILFSIYEAADGSKLVNDEDIKNDFNIDIQNRGISLIGTYNNEFQFESIDTDLSVDDLIAKILVEDFSEMEFLTIPQDEFLKGTSLRNLNAEFDALVTKCKELKIDPRDLEQFIATKK